MQYLGDVTEKLIAKSQSLLSVIDEPHDWTGKHYRCFNTGSVEIETAEFLYGWIKLLKPERVLDTGSHFGVSALYMAQALVENGNGGTVDSIEHDGFYMEKAKQLWQACGVSNAVRAIQGKSLEHSPNDFYKTDKPYDFMLLDTEPDIRFAEFVRFYPYLKPGGYIFIHDLHRHMSQTTVHGKSFGFPFGRLPKEFIQWVRTGELRSFHLPTPRGLAGFYKVDPRDYDWNAVIFED